MRTIDPDKHAAQRQAVLDAAKTCFARYGFHKTSTEAICAEAGTSSGKLFHYFPTKKAIILAVVEDQQQETATYLDELLQREDLSTSLLEFLDAILHLSGSREERRLILEIVAEAARDDDVGALNTSGDELLGERLATLLREATARGQAAPVVPPENAVRFLMVLIDGIFSRASVDADFDPAKERASLRRILRGTLGLVGDDADD